MIDSLYDDAREGMGKSIDALKNEFKKVRTGRASLALFEGIKVSYYNTHPVEPVSLLVCSGEQAHSYSALGSVGHWGD